MTPITKFEEQVAYMPMTGVCVPRQRRYVEAGWTYRIVDTADLPSGDQGEGQ